MKLFIFNLTALFVFFLVDVNAINCTGNKLGVNGVCKEVSCKNDDDCAIAGTYCANRKQKTYCRAVGICECFGVYQTQGAGNIPKPSCNKALNGNDKCKPGEICKASNGLCIKDPMCSFFGESCQLPGRRCCNPQIADGDILYCHKRKGSTASSCVHFANTGDSCAGGIPCEDETVCLPSKICSKKPLDGCDNNPELCPPNTTCQDVPHQEGVNKECVPANYGHGDI